MAESELADLRKQCITSLYVCTDNVCKYLDDEKDKEFDKLKSYVADYSTMEAQQKVAIDALEKARRETDSSNMDTLEERFQNHLSTLSAKRLNVNQHPYMIEYNNRVKKGLQKAQETGPETKNSETVSSVWSPRKTHAYLKIIPVKIVGPAGEVHTHALLDDGSTVTLIDAAIARQAGLTGPFEPLNIAAIADTKMKACHSRRVKVTLQGERAQYTINARTIDNIRLSAQTVKSEDLRNCAHLRDIAQQLKYEAARPKILMVRQGQQDEPVASHTPLGWVLHGAHTRMVDKKHHRVNCHTTHEDDLREPLIVPTRPHSNLEGRATSTLAKCTKQTEASRSCRRYAARRDASIEDHSTVHDRRWASKMNVSSTATRDVHRLKGRPHSVVQTTATDQCHRRRESPRHRRRRRRRRRREQLMIEPTGSDERAGHPALRACGARRPSPRSAMTTTASMHGGKDLNESDLAITESQDQYIDPITRKAIVDPVKNNVCGHIYEKDAIFKMIKMKDRVRCPVAGCGNKGPILEKHLVSDEELKFRLAVTQHSTMIQERSYVNLDQTME
ncbi:unnamed protein product [Plutella xylostella]|uniref:E3 SUMO-protein ligase NSE2 n=1 Tax=Plutella xylostella TaxID=51655 RepID=A0A8S4FGF2_PLUXY|nr:unnamed protein product [Plutella xylostella]